MPQIKNKQLKIAVSKAASARRAVTHYRVMETFAGADGRPAISLVELELETGRTHQIRVHLSHSGYPVLGDQLYGAGFKTRSATLTEAAKAAVERLNRQALHATGLGFEHPASGRTVQFESDFPQDLQEVVQSLQLKPKSAPSKVGGARRKIGR